MQTPEVCLPTEAMPIDEWFFAQDRAVDDEMKVVRKNKNRRRSLDQADIDVRAAQRVFDQRAEYGRLLAIAKAIYRLTASNEPLYGYKLVSGAHTCSDNVSAAYEAKYGEEIDDYDLGPLERVAFTNHEHQVRCAVVAEMRQEMEERADAKLARKEHAS